MADGPYFGVGLHNPFGELGSFSLRRKSLAMIESSWRADRPRTAQRQTHETVSESGSRGRSKKVRSYATGRVQKH